MKKFLLLISLAVTIVSCENLQKEYPQYASTTIVKKQTSNGVRYGIGCDTPKKNVYKALSPVVFVDYKPASTFEYFLFPEDSKIYYMLNNYGEEVLSGTSNTKNTDGFVPIINDGRDHQLTEAEKYYGQIVGWEWYNGSVKSFYYILPTIDNCVYGVICTYECLAIGPYQQMRFGLKGYMYQDAKTGKFGAKAVASTWSTTGNIKKSYIGSETEIERQLNLRTPVIFTPEYDEIIEVKVNDKRDIWFAHKGNKWIAKEVVKTSKVQDIAVDQKLLNRVLKMQPQKEAKWRIDPNDLYPSHRLAYGQRVGTKEMSIVYIK